MLEPLRRRIPASWKSKLAPLAERLTLDALLALTERGLWLTAAIWRKVYVKHCVRKQAKKHRAAHAQRHGSAAKSGGWPRPVGVVIAGVMGLLVLATLGVWGYYGLHLEHGIDLSKWLEPNTVTGTLLSVLVGSPVAYIIWRYRDQNTLWQIENQRKDINLKDFQKLAEWASGQHLQEDKVVEQTKRTEKATANGPEVTTETVTTREGSTPPDHARSVNKRTGGESLQVAAVYQLQAFLDGEFGKHFQRPAFQLLKSLWEGLVREHVGKLDAILQVEDDTRKQQLNAWQQGLQTLTTTPLGLALNESLATGAGRHLHLHPQDVPGAMLTGLNTRAPGLEPWALAGLNLQGIQLQGAKLQGAGLQGANLQEAKLQWANLQEANLQRADLEEANLQEAKLQWANLQWANLQEANLQRANLQRADLEGADLEGADLEGANLQWANLQWANLQWANLQWANLKWANLEWANLEWAALRWAKLRWAKLRGADLQEADLQGADLQGADLRGADLRGTTIDSQTQLHQATYNAQTRFGRLKKGGYPWNDADWSDAEAEEQRWRALGALRLDEVPTF